MKFFVGSNYCKFRRFSIDYSHKKVSGNLLLFNLLLILNFKLIGCKQYNDNDLYSLQYCNGDCLCCLWVNLLLKKTPSRQGDYGMASPECKRTKQTMSNYDTWIATVWFIKNGCSEETPFLRVHFHVQNNCGENLR